MSSIEEYHPFDPSNVFHIATNQMTGFCMKCNVGLKWADKALTIFQQIIVKANIRIRKVSMFLLITATVDFFPLYRLSYTDIFKENSPKYH